MQVAQDRTRRVTRQNDGLAVRPPIYSQILAESINPEFLGRSAFQHLFQELPGMNPMSGASPKAQAVPQKLAVVTYLQAPGPNEAKFA